MNPDRELLERLIQEKGAWYKTIGKVWNPLLGKYVVFSSKGFRHLRYKQGNKPRPIKDQIYRLTLLPLAIPVIKNSQTIYDYTKRSDFEIWELRETVGKNSASISVVLRKIRNGNLTFLSIWKNGAD